MGYSPHRGSLHSVLPFLSIYIITDPALTEEVRKEKLTFSKKSVIIYIESEREIKK
jgi:hypothetical protein